MQTPTQTTPLHLARGAISVFTGTAATQIRCEDGVLWLTQDNDPRDVVLKPGETFQPDRRWQRARLRAGERRVLVGPGRRRGPPAAALFRRLGWRPTSRTVWRHSCRAAGTCSSRDRRRAAAEVKRAVTDSPFIFPETETSSSDAFVARRQRRMTDGEQAPHGGEQRRAARDRQRRVEDDRRGVAALVEISTLPSDRNVWPAPALRNTSSTEPSCVIHTPPAQHAQPCCRRAR